MMQPERERKKYPLLPYSQLVWDMMQADKNVYTFASKARVKNETGRAERITEALKTALGNHPVFSMRVDDKGMQYYQPADDILHGQFHSVDIEEKGDYIELTITFNRILGDGISGILVMEDLLRAYQGLPLEKDDYIEYLEQTEQAKQTERYAADKQWLEAKFDRLTAPVHPTPDYPLTCAQGWEEGLLTDDWSDIQNAAQETGREYMVTLTGIVSLAAVLATMDYNGTDEAALTWAYNGRETPAEQRIYGSLHRDIPLYISRERKTKDKEQKRSLLKQVRTEIRQGIVHSAYPYTLTRPHTLIWNYALNVLQQPILTETLLQMPFEVELMEDSKHTAYSLLDVEIYAGESLSIAYRYSATHYKQESIRRFAAMVKENAEWLLTD